MNIFGFTLNFITEGFAVLYCGIAVFMWVVSLLFSKEYMAHYDHKKRYYILMIVTWIATMGVFASGDYLTTFVFYEMMSLASYILVIHEEKPIPMRAGETYLAVAIIGGMIILMGIFLLYDALGTLKFSELSSAMESYLAGGGSKGRIYAIGICLLLGFGAKSGMFPFHIWLPKEGPAAPAPVSALISGIITKTCVFGIIVVSTRLFFGNRIWGIMLSIIAAITMFLGALLALFSVNLKRTLACSSISQIGFILTGISMIVLLGEENALASMGTILHMVNHSMIKLLLFSCAGAIYMKRHALDLNALRGYGRNKPYLMVLFLIGAVSISGVPGTSGYISKTLLHEAVVEYIEHAHHLGYSTMWFSIFEWVFLISGGITFCYMTKLFICLFIEKNPDPVIEERYESKDSYMSKLTTACLTAPAVVLVCMGALPHQIMDRLAEMARPFLCGAELEHTVHYFSLVNIKGSAISLCIGLVLYLTVVRFLMMRKVKFSARYTEAMKAEINLPEGSDDSFEVDSKVYVNLWPEIVDLEDQFFRILIADLLKPGIFGKIDTAPEKIISLFTRTDEQGS